jgi:hypothetical protein
MTHKLIAIILASSLLASTAFAAEGNSSGSAAPAAASSASAPQPSSQEQSSSNTQSESKARKRSYERETRTHHPGISKQEMAFMAAIAGTSMGIGALAGGGRGLAIGAIVGGWGAYAGHRLWKWMKK